MSRKWENPAILLLCWHSATKIYTSLDFNISVLYPEERWRGSSRVVFRRKMKSI